MELENRTELEREFARKFAALSARHKRELIRLLGTPPNPANVPAEFWERVKKETEEEAAALMLIILLQSNRQYVKRVEPVIVQSGRDVQQVNDQLDASSKQWAGDRAREFSEGYTDNSLAIINRIQPPTDDGEGDTDAEQVVDQAFGPTRVETVAVTETTEAASAAGEMAVDATVGRGEGDTWFTAEDNRVCPICGPLHGRTRSRWSRFFPSGPPAHPRCRCVIQYAFETANQGDRTPTLVGAAGS